MPQEKFLKDDLLKKTMQAKKIQATTARAAAERKAKEAADALAKAEEAEAALLAELDAGGGS